MQSLRDYLVHVWRLGQASRGHTRGTYPSSMHRATLLVKLWPIFSLAQLPSLDIPSPLQLVWLTDTNKMTRWMHSETVILIDCLHEARRLGNWSWEQRRDLVNQVQRKLEASGFPGKSRQDINVKISGVGRRWTTKDKSDPFALYCYGWEALKEKCSRSMLLSDPTGRYIPKAILQPPTSNLRRSLSPEKRCVKLANFDGRFTLRNN